MHSDLEARIALALRDVPDFPKKGILFKDITPLLAQPALFAEVVEAMLAPFFELGVTAVVGIESRGFLFGMPIALALGTGFVPVRKPGKLPWRSIRESFSLEYGVDALEMHEDALSARDRVLIVDDILATGGTVRAACRLCERLGATVAGVSVLADIAGLRSATLLPPDRPGAFAAHCLKAAVSGEAQTVHSRDIFGELPVHREGLV